ncbi:MAG: hypothetical protein LBM97_02565 [Candidatus Nomurabacteria bacterium]|nr:hypothetical protein [Candidatus Nomurabacteria bacterium]
MKLGLRKAGFTIVEVVLVLAISGALFVGLLAVQGNNLARKRYADAVNNFRDFMSSQYDFSVNIQNWRDGEVPAGSCGTTGDGHLGRSNCVIYGVMVEFGQGDCNEGAADRSTNCYARVNYVVGLDYDYNSLFDADGQNHIGSDQLEDLTILQSDTVALRRAGPGLEYHFQWGAGVTAPDVWIGDVHNADRGVVQGAILILRAPVSNTIKTFVYNGPLTGVGGILGVSGVSAFDESGDTEIYDGDFIEGNANVGVRAMVNEDNMVARKFMCIRSSDNFLLGGASSQRILSVGGGSNNGSAVQLLDQDTPRGMNGGGGSYMLETMRWDDSGVVPRIITEEREYEVKCE